MKIGLYGGTFDPIHHGHLILARTAKEELGLLKVVFIPAAISPHKLHAAPTPPGIRWEMLCTAVAGEPGFEADDLEIRRRGPSYTYDTAEIYSRNFPEAQIFYFIGDDNLSALHTWHRIEELRKLVTFVVLNRGCSRPLRGRAEDVNPSGVTDPCYNYLEINRRFDISASEIRNRVAKGLSIRYLVGERVEELIRQRNLYQNPFSH